MPDNAKFSNFVSGGDIQGGDTLVGLRAGVNTKFLYAGPDGPDIETPTVASLVALSGAGIVCRIGIASFRLRTLQGHANQINVFDGTGEFTDPLLSLSSTLDAPGTFTIQGSVAVDSIIDDDTFLTASATNIPTAASVKAYVDGSPAGAVQTVFGTANQILVDSSDPANPVASLSTAINTPGTLNINSSTAVSSIIDDDTMATASVTSLATSASIKAYVDGSPAGSVQSVVGTANQIDVNSADPVNPVISLSTSLNAPGTLNIQSTTAVDSIIDDDTMATASATSLSTSESIKAYVDSSSSGLVDSVFGTPNQVNVNNVDPANPIVSLSPTISTPGTFTVQGTVALDAVIDDDTFATATNTNIPTSESVKAYVDSSHPAGGVVDTIVPTPNQILVDSSDPENPVVSLSTTINTPGVFNIQGSTEVGSIIDDDTMVTASSTSLSTSESIKAYVDSAGSGLVDSVSGTTNQVNVNNLDPANPVVLLSSTLNAPGTFRIQGTVAVDSIIDDDSFLTASATNIPTSSSVKAYVDASHPPPGGVVDSVVGTADQIDVDSSDAANPVVSLSPTMDAPGTLNIQSTTAVSSIIDDDTMATASATSLSTSESIKAYVDSAGSGLVDSVSGTINQVNVNNLDPANPIVSLSSALNVPGTFRIQGTVPVNSIIDDDTMLTASATNIPTAESVKAYVDSSGSGSIHSVQVFTSSGTWTRPANVNAVKIAMVGGGGGSGGLGHTFGGPHRAISSGGGGGEYACSVFEVSGISSATVTIGDGGCGGAAGEHAGDDGGDTSFDGIVVASGGRGGCSLEMAWSSFSVEGGAGGTGGTGDILIGGSGGAGAQVIDRTPLIYSHGGQSHFSGSAISSNLPRVDVPGSNYGGGAAGLHQSNSSSPFPGADGAAGICIVWEYY